MESLAKWIPGCSKYFGGESQQKLIFVPDADNKPEEDHEISEPALFRFLLNEETLIELDEAEAEIPEMLKVLKDVEKGSKITEFETHQSSISMLKDFKRAFHVFVVFKTTCKTDGNYWWSLEKNRDYIALQRSRNKNNVKDKCYGEPRNQVKPIVENLDGKGTIQDLFAVLWAHQIIPGKYNIFKSNCQSFVTFVSQEITQEEYKYQGYFPYSPPPDSGRDQKMLDLINILKGCSNFPPLLTVILMGNINLVDKIVASGNYDINAFYDGFTPLEFAIFSSRTKMVQHLLQHPMHADPTKRDEMGSNALHSATWYTTNTEIFDLLLEHDKVKVDDVDENGESALHKAAYFSNVIAVQKLLEKGANPNIVDKNGASPLHFVAPQSDGIPIIDLLLEAQKVKGKGDVNDRDYQGRTALHYAAGSSNEITAEHLITKGADIHYRDKYNATPLHMAAMCAKDIEFVNLFLRNIKDGDTSQFRKDNRLFFSVMSNVHGLAVEIGDRLVKKGIKPPSTLTDDCITAESDNKATGVNTHRFVDKGVDFSIDLTGCDGLDFLITRINKSMEINEILKEEEFDINGLNQDGETPLLVAILGNNVNAVKLLLERGADPTIRDENGNTPFHVAAIVDRDCHVLNLLLESGKVDINETTTEYGLTALHIAIGKSNVTAVRFLLSKGANPNVACKNKGTPLHLAVMFAKDMDIVELLLNHKDTNVNCLDKLGINALDYAYKFNAQGHGERIANRLKEKGAVETQIKQLKIYIESMKKHMRDNSNRKPCEEENVISDDSIPIKDKIAKISKNYVVSAIEDSNVETLRLLLTNGADISSARGEDGENALHFASLKAKTTDVIEFVLETGKFDINGVDNDGLTPLHWAILNSNVDIARYLLEKGADPTIRNRNGNTPLHKAAGYAKEIETINLILETQKVDIDHINKEGETALYYAIRAENVQMVRCLLEKGADPTSRNNVGCTPFHLAVALLTDTDILGLMLANEIKIDIDEKNKLGLNALHMATFASNVTAVRFLLSNGANPNVADENGLTPLHVAAHQAKDMYLIEALLNHKDTNVNYLDNKGHNALQYAMRNKHGLREEIANLLREKRATKAEGNNHKSKKVAASVPAGRVKQDSDIKTIRLLIENGQDISAMTWGENGANALHLAAAGEETTDLIDVILETGKFDINGVDNDGKTPLHYAIKRPKPITINSRRLIKMGANPSVPDKNGVTPLHMAARNAESMDLIELLLNTEAVDVNHYDHNGTRPTPLAYARANKHGIGQRIIARLKKYDDEKK
jgi:ankyrin repeat protein